MASFIQFIKSKFTPQQKTNIKLFFKNILAFFVSHNLTALAKIYGSDKWGGHFYTPHYQKYFKKFRFRKINFLEIGVGGYEDPYAGGNSLRMWKKFFLFGKIYSLDIYDKSPQEESRIKIFKGSQVDAQFLNKIITLVGEFDLIVDDGSHINKHIIESFKILFPKLKLGGFYVIEDTQTSYWPHYGGDSNDLNNPHTMYTFFKSLIDGLNHEELMISEYQKTYYDKHIVAMHFYHNMIFIEKGLNNEPSNYLVNNKVKNSK
jgi:hypothetical protein